MVNLQNRSTQDTYSKNGIWPPVVFAGGIMSMASLAASSVELPETTSQVNSHVTIIVNQQASQLVFGANKLTVTSTLNSLLTNDTEDLEADLSELYQDLASKQVALDSNLEQVLHENIWDLYIEA